MVLLYVYALLSLALARLPLLSSIAVVAAAETTNIAASQAASTALTFGGSKWIWSTSTEAFAVVALRKAISPPFGRSLIAAEIIITGVDTMNLYVNGDYIGSGAFPRRWGYAQRFCVDLLPGLNVFAVNASTADPGSGGLIATILVTYSDGTSDTLVTDTSWRSTNGSPAGFEQLSFDDNTWPVATIVGGAALSSSILIPANPPALGLDTALWVWTDESPKGDQKPTETRAFRRTFTPAPGQIPMSANILISADDGYDLYVNGVFIGSGTNWVVAQHYIVNFGTPTSEIILAVRANNIGASAAGVLVAMEVNMKPSGRTNCTAGSLVASDNGWKSTRDIIPTGFEQPNFDDSTWPVVDLEVVYKGPGPWGSLTIAAAAAPITI